MENNIESTSDMQLLIPSATVIPTVLVQPLVLILRGMERYSPCIHFLCT